ncbi:hypothetical protein ACQZV8_19655 [Magnetococcales bacterium HHB-1]
MAQRKSLTLVVEPENLIIRRFGLATDTVIRHRLGWCFATSSIGGGVSHPPLQYAAHLMDTIDRMG